MQQPPCAKPRVPERRGPGSKRIAHRWYLDLVYCYDSSETCGLPRMPTARGEPLRAYVNLKNFLVRLVRLNCASNQLVCVV